MEATGWFVFWVFFWIVHFFFAVGGAKPVIWLEFCGFLALMRATNNQMSTNCWVAFWLSFIYSYGDFFKRIQSNLWWSLVAMAFAVRVFLITADYLMPTPVFWILVFSLFLTDRGDTAGNLIQVLIVMFNWNPRFDAIHIPGLTISWYYIQGLIVLILMASTIMNNPGYIPAVFTWFLAVAVLHDQMWPYNKEFGWLWAGAWLLLEQALLHVFAPSMPAWWYMAWVGIVVGLGFVFHPELGLWRFVSWAITIWILRMVLFIVYLFYYVAGLRPDLFPFNLFSSKWKMSEPLWLPINSQSAEMATGARLCQQCDGFTSNSKLIMGSKSYLSELVEWHPFWTRATFTAKFTHQTSAIKSTNYLQHAPSPTCRLCCLLWYSMSMRRREAMIATMNQETANIASHEYDASLTQPKDLQVELRVKVWVQRPLNLYTYMQLFWGDVAIGARLLVHRNELVSAPSPSLQYARTDSDAHFEQAKHWIQLCRNSHSLCSAPGNSRPELPARIVYVEGGVDWRPGKTPAIIKLVHTHGKPLPGDYLALSHCWGPPSQMRFKLLASNIESCYSGMDFHNLSQNMQDALTVTLSLGFSYIWIDSLCIIQKDSNSQQTDGTAEMWKADWDIESKKMGSIYSGASCTIASTGSPTSAGGCFHDRSVIGLGPCKLGLSSLDDFSPSWIYARRDDVFDFERNVDLAPLNTRGWVMQERLLSRRILHFGADMIYWECCCRSASELTPNGYTYKRFPEDFKNNYTPDLEDKISTRGEMQRAEAAGRGFSWAMAEDVRRRPPPVTIDPDSPPSTQVVWQQKRGFWRNVLKRSSESWKDDERDGSADRARAGFRAAFEQLRGGGGYSIDVNTDLVGKHSFSQVWYDIIESYSHRKLTSPGDKLIALKGIEDEIARATGYTYLYGLWKEKLLTDLLWFAIEGPGYRLLNAQEVPVAPTWSWASIEGAVALDLLPDTSPTKVKLNNTLVTIEGPVLNGSQPHDMGIMLKGPLMPISTPVFDGISWSMVVDQTGHPSAKLFPDLKSSDICSMSGLFCLTFLVLNRKKATSSSEDVQGLLLRLVGSSKVEHGLNIYERVGYFTTSYVEESEAAREGRKLLKQAEMKRICLTGWSGV